MKIKCYIGSLKGHFGYEKYLMEDGTVIVVNEVGGNGETFDAWRVVEGQESSFEVLPVYRHEDGQYILEGWKF